MTGPIVAHIWAELNGASDATLVAVLSDVNPQGQSNQLTAGYLLASQHGARPQALDLRARGDDPSLASVHQGLSAAGDAQ